MPRLEIKALEKLNYFFRSFLTLSCSPQRMKVEKVKSRLKIQ